MPVGLNHNADDILDVLVRHFRLEQIAHAVYENSARARPVERLGELGRDETEIESLLIGVAYNAAKALGESLGVTVHDLCGRCCQAIFRRVSRIVSVLGDNVGETAARLG